MEDSVISVLVNWKNFHGRAFRSEFWYFCFASGLLGFIIAFVEVATGILEPENAGADVLSTILSVAIILLSLSVTSRRLQDEGLSGWWQLSYVTFIGIFIVMVLYALPAKDGENKWEKNFSKDSSHIEGNWRVL